MSRILLRRLTPHPHTALVYRRLVSAGGPRCYSSGEGWRAPPQDDEGRAVRVSVWWDFENCHIPNGVNICRVAPRLAAALRAAGIRGPLSITAFGDVLQLARSSQEALAATGVSISHVPRNGKNSSDRSFMADLVYWITQNPPPVHFFLISGDRDFANMLHRLRMSNYNVLLACPNTASSVLCSAATIMWPWDALVKGENFSPKHFNHPPDGLYGSWYGHYKGVLDVPFLETEPKEPIEEPSASKHCAIPSDSMHCSVPKYVTTGIQETLKLFPEGISLSLLRAELRKKNIDLGTDYFGHNKFSSFMHSMPDIAQFIKAPPNQDEPYVTAVDRRLPRSGAQSSKTQSSAQCNVKEDNPIQTEHPSFTSPCISKLDSEPLSSFQSVDGKRSFVETVNGNPSTFAISSSGSQNSNGSRHFPETVNGSPSSFAGSSSLSDALSEDQKEYPTVDAHQKSKLSANHRELDERTTPETPSPSVVEKADNKDGLFKRIWVLWNGPENTKYEGSQNHKSTPAEVVDELRIPLHEHNADHHRKLLKRLKKNGHSDGSDCTAAASDNLSILSDDECCGNIKRDASVLENSEPCNGPASLPTSKTGEKDDTSRMNKGLISWASRWWRFGKSDAGNCTTNVTDEAVTDSTEESESRSTSTCGSGQVPDEIFTKSYFWDILEQQLSKPLGSELVSKVKTRQELVHGLQKLGCWPLRGLLDKDLHQLVHLLVTEKKWIEETPSSRFPFCVTLPQKRTCVPSNSSKYNGLSSIFSNVKPSQQGNSSSGNSKTNRPLNREEILSDCQQLLRELFLQYGYGFNIRIFKRRFAKKHGYELDHQKLGYPDLESLLQIMPDARVKFPMVLPVETGNGQGSSKGNGNQNNGDIWDELGPLSATTETIAGTDKEICYCPPTPSDDEFSDNDSPADQEPRRDAEQSSLLQIIDSWNSSKDGGSRKKTEEIDGLVDCSRGHPGNVDNLISGNAQRPARPSQKQYSFVSESEEDQEKDKLVESVLGSLEKARGSKLNS